MLSSFLRVLNISAPVLEPCRCRHAAARREPLTRASAPRHGAPPLRPTLLNPPMATPSPTCLVTGKSAAARQAMVVVPCSSRFWKLVLLVLETGATGFQLNPSFSFVCWACKIHRK